MAKLYPPYVEGKLPAFTGTTLVVPFSMNKAVGVGGSEVAQMCAQLKYINSDTVIYAWETAASYNLVGNCYATFNLPNSYQDKLKVGQFYRVQLAYVGVNAEKGYFSSTGVIKYTSKPLVSILKLDAQTSNHHQYDYTCQYVQDGDNSEKLYSSNLVLWDSDYNVVYQSPEVIHSRGNDTLPNQTTESFTIAFELDPNKRYRMKWTATTVNGLTVSTPEYRIIAMTNGGVEYQAVTNLFVNVASNYSRGTVDITLAHQDPNVRVMKGMFRLCRSEYKEPYEWKFIRNIFMTNKPIKDVLICDYTIEQGKTYIYSLQQFNNKDVVSNRTISAPITIDFEDYYLIDQHKQLKIRYNPRISQMSNQIVENKTDTIGSKYPFITRSGVVHYKEFSLSGLISYHMDNDQDFMSWSDLGFDMAEQSRKNTDPELPATYSSKTPSFNLTPENIAAERIFKLEVLEWLDNGEPKILKTPTEGSYLVVLMNNSLSPNDTVSRMLHSFSCNAYEIGPYDYDTLAKYGFFDLENRDAKLEVPQWVTVELAKYDTQFVDHKRVYTGGVTYASGNLIRPGGSVTTIDIKNVVPGTKMEIGDEIVTIGATGAYFAKVTKPITYIAIVPEKDADGNEIPYVGEGTLTYQTTGPLNTDFDLIQGYKDAYRIGQQFVGSEVQEIIGTLSNTRDVVIDILGVRFFKRNVVDVYTMKQENGNNKEIPLVGATYYYDAYGLEEIPKNPDVVLTAYKGQTYDWNNPLTLFRINWLNYYTNEDDVDANDEPIKHYYDSRMVTHDVTEYDDGSVSQSSELYYFTWKNGRVDEQNQFPVDSGYLYDPRQRIIIENDYSIYSARVGYYRDNNLPQMENISIEEKEFMYLSDTFKPAFIYPGEGIITDITYSWQSILYSYEEDLNLSVPGAKLAYDKALKSLVKFLQNGVFNENTGQFIIQRFDDKIDALPNGLTAAMLNAVTGQYISPTNPEKVTDEIIQKRYLYEDQLRSEVKRKYKDLIDALQYAIATDLTRG